MVSPEKTLISVLKWKLSFKKDASFRNGKTFNAKEED